MLVLEEWNNVEAIFFPRKLVGLKTCESRVQNVFYFVIYLAYEWCPLAILLFDTIAIGLHNVVLMYT